MVVLLPNKHAMQSGWESGSRQHQATPPTAATGKPEVNPNLILFIGRRPESVDFPAIIRNDAEGSPGMEV
jgi:hypothetical protein